MSTEELILTIEDPAKISYALAASGPYPLRVAFEMDETVQEIVKFGSAAQEDTQKNKQRASVGNLVLRRIQDRRIKEIDDISMACFCYILETIGFKEAVPELVNLLSEMYEIMKQGEMAFTLYFATNAIKVLTEQPDLRKDLSYSDREIEETIMRVESLRGRG